MPRTCLHHILSLLRILKENLSVASCPGLPFTYINIYTYPGYISALRIVSNCIIYADVCIYTHIFIPTRPCISCAYSPRVHNTCRYMARLGSFGVARKLLLSHLLYFDIFNTLYRNIQCNNIINYTMVLILLYINVYYTIIMKLILFDIIGATEEHPFSHFFLLLVLFFL